MYKIIFMSLVALLLTACASPLFAPSTPTATLTSTPTATAPLTPTPTETATPIPTATVTPSFLVIHSRDEFEEMVKSGLIKCQGSTEGSNLAVTRFMEEASAAGVVPNSKYILGSGIPSANDPRECVFLMTFNEGKTTLVYQDSETGEYVAIVLEE